MMRPKESHSDLRAKLRRAQQGSCCYCGCKMIKYPPGPAPKGGWPSDAETLEHLTMRKYGGVIKEDNVALACYECNAGRGDIYWFTYASYRRGELHAA